MNSAENSLKELSEIRRLMEKSTRFLSLSGLSGIIAGIAAILGALVAYFVLHYNARYFQPDVYFSTYYNLPVSRYIYLLVVDGLAVLLIALGSGFYFSYRKAKRTGEKFFDTTALRLLINLGIPLATGGFFCIILLYYKVFFLIGPSTLLFYGLALINGSKYTLGEIRYLGLSEIILGLVSMMFPGYTILFWSIGFGVLHIIYGSIMFYRYER